MHIALYGITLFILYWPFHELNAQFHAHFHQMRNVAAPVQEIDRFTRRGVKLERINHYKNINMPQENQYF